MGAQAAARPSGPRAPVIVRGERCRVGFWPSIAKHMRFLSTELVGAWRNGGVLWESPGRKRLYKVRVPSAGRLAA